MAKLRKALGGKPPRPDRSDPMTHHKPPRTARTTRLLLLLSLKTTPKKKLTVHAKDGKRASVVDDQ